MYWKCHHCTTPLVVISRAVVQCPVCAEQYSKAQPDGQPWRRNKYTAYAGAQATTLAIVGFNLAVQMKAAERAGVVSTASCGLALVAALTGGALLTVKRSTDAAGVVNDAAQNATAYVIKEVGKEGKKYVPIFFGIRVPLLLLALHFLVMELWKRDSKREMLRAERILKRTCLC